MSGRRRLILFLALAGSIVGLMAGTCGVFVYQFQHAGEGPEHRFSVPGSAELTDAEALALAQQVMELDGRYKPSMQIVGRDWPKGAEEPVRPGTDRAYTTVEWVDLPAGRQWFVRLHREDGAVTGRSYPGR